MTRRQFLTSSTAGLAAFHHLEAAAPYHHEPKAKRVIYLFQSGGPSQLETFDYKPKLRDLYKSELPASIRMGQRLTGLNREAVAPAAG